MTPARAFLLLALLVAHPARAEAPVSSIFPLPRPVVAGAAAAPVAAAATDIPPARLGAISLTGAAAPVPAAPPDGGMQSSIRPRQRPAGATQTAAPGPQAHPAPDAAAASASTSAAAIAPDLSVRPRRGLFGFLQAGNATRTQPDPGTITSRAGSVCGIPGIKGVTLAPIQSRIGDCGVAAPVSVTSVDGVTLTPGASLDCATATALYTWVQDAAKPAVARYGGGLAGLTIAGSYECRSRNHVQGAKISEHGKGKAIDIAALVLGNGEQITIAQNYKSGTYSKMLKSVHNAACGIFGTTLGPGSDGMHEDHLHFDTASYRSGSYCR